MNLLILDGPRSKREAFPNYRGTNRAHPSHCDYLPDDHEINLLFNWFLEEGGELGVVHDLQKALRFAFLWNSVQKEESFEVIEVQEGNGSPESNGELIGFDLSAGYNYSLVCGGLQSPVSAVEDPEAILELSLLLSRFYRPKLNAQGLFQDHEVASQCLKSMIALQALCPNLYESGDLTNFKITALYRVPGNSLGAPVGVIGGWPR